MNNIYVQKARLSVRQLLVRAMLAGAFIALAGVASTWASMMVENPSLRRLIAGCIFPAGLAMIVLTGVELFTGNCLMSVALFSKKIKLTQMLKNWAVVYIGNLMGAMGIAALVARGGTFASYEANIIATAHAKILEFDVALCRGILCNILVCLGVVMAQKSEDAGSKVITMFFPVAAFVIAGYEHSVANMYYFSVAHFLGATITLREILQYNLLPVTIGNIIGGSLILGGGLWFMSPRSDAKHT